MFLLFWKIYFSRKKELKIKFSGNVPGKKDECGLLAKKLRIR
jgi:hypothetical protein